MRIWALIPAALSAGLAGMGLARAADMPPLVRKAPAAAPLVDRWRGIYVGGNLGYGFARSDNSLINSSGLQHENFDLGVTGVVGGGQVGFNWHLSPNWVAGLEADFQGSKQNASACTDICNSQFGLFAFTEQKISWFDTVRARLGWTNGPSLLYVTGGLAYGQVKTWLNEKLDTAPFSNITFTHNKSGWTAGTGIETWLSGQWTAKAEYLYLYLGHTSDSFVYLNAPLVILTRDSRVQNHVVRLGVNYHLAAHAAAPAPAATAPVPANWNGFYVGANIGYGVGRNPTTLTDRTPAGTVFVSEHYGVGIRGTLGGGQIGFNWQTAPNWLIGIEADLQAANVAGSSCTSACVWFWYAKAEQKLSWLGTARGRLGWVNGSTLFYVTGGLAFGEMKTSIVHRINNPPGPAPSGQFEYTKTGWTVGGGIEAILANNWSAKVEYLYVDLGDATETILYPANNNTNFTTQVSFHTHVARLGLNYHFGGTDLARARY